MRRLWATLGVYLFYFLSLLLIKALHSPIIDRGFSRIFLPYTLALAFFLFSLLVLRKGKDPWWMVLVFGPVFSLALAWYFKGVAFAMGGGAWDSWFYTSMVEKFRHFWASVDYAYRGLHSFYPFYLHYLLGKMAWATGLPAYRILKYFLIILPAFLPLIVYHSYRPFFSSLSSAGLAIFLPFFFWSLLLYKPYEFLVLVLLIPWWLYFWEEERGSPLWGGILGGVLFATYYYWFFPVFLLMFYELLSALGRSRDLRKFWSREKKRLLIFPYFLLASLPYWGGYLWDVLAHGGEFAQQKWFKPWHLDFFLPMRATGVLDLLALLGLGFLLISKEKISSRVFSLLLAGYAFFLLGNIGALLGSPLLQLKINDFVKLGFVLGFFLLLDILKGRTRQAASVLLVLIATFAILRVNNLKKDLLFRQAEKHRPLNIEGRMLWGKTVLAAPAFLLDFVPCYVFANFNPYFSHPAALLSKRLSFLYLLQFSRNPEFFSYILQENRIQKVDFVYFHKGGFFGEYFSIYYPHRYRLKYHKFRYRFKPSQVGKIVRRDVVKKGDKIVALRRVMKPANLSPMERFILSRFGKSRENFPSLRRFGEVDLYRAGRFLVFFREGCHPLEVPEFRIILSEEKGRKEIKFSLSESGILGRTCAAVFKIPRGAQLLEIKPQSPRQ